MLKVSKVLIILSMIFGAIFIFPIFIGVYGLRRLKEAQTTSDLRTPGIIVLLFCNLISGVLMLVATQEDIDSYRQSNGLNVNSYNSSSVNISDVTGVSKDSLAILQDLYNDNLISLEEYEEKKSKYLESILNEKSNN